MTHCQILSIFFSSDSMGKKAIRTLIGFEISETGKVARSQYPDRLNLALAISLTELPKQGTIRGYERRPTMQLKLAIDEAAASTAHKSTAQYSIVLATNAMECMTWGSRSRWKMALPASRASANSMMGKACQKI